MFEKEAEEYGTTNYESCMYDNVKGWDTDRKAREQAFKDGAEFGYNNAYKWHYVENGDLPKETIPVLILSSDYSVDDCIYIPGEGFKHPVFSNWYNPVAWIEKEKVLPKKEIKWHFSNLIWVEFLVLETGS